MQNYIFYSACERDFYVELSFLAQNNQFEIDIFGAKDERSFTTPILSIDHSKFQFLVELYFRASFGRFIKSLVTLIREFLGPSPSAFSRKNSKPQEHI